MVESLMHLWDVDPGFKAHNVETFSISLPPAMASATPGMIRAKHLALNQALAAVPGVTAVSQTWGAVPMAGEDDQWFWIDGQPKPRTNNDMSWVIDYIVDPDYQRVMQIPLKRGRFLSRLDDEHAPLVVVVDEVFANKYFPGQDPIGKRIDLDNFGGKAAQIVGVVGHVKQWGLDSDDTEKLRAQYYLACMQVSDDFFAWHALGKLVPGALRRQSRARDQRAAQHGAPDEQPASAVRRADHRKDCCRFDGAATVCHDPAGRVCRAGSFARVRGHLRSDGLPGVATDAGGGNPHGARGATE